MTTTGSRISQDKTYATASADQKNKVSAFRLVGLVLLGIALIFGGLKLIVGGSDPVFRVGAEERSSEQQAIKILNGTEVTELFSDATVTGTHQVQKFQFTHYYAADGTLESTRSDRGPATGRWGVSPGGRLCVQLRGRKELCRMITIEQGLYRKVLNKSGKNKVIVTYSGFRRGRHAIAP